MFREELRDEDLQGRQVSFNSTHNMMNKNKHNFLQWSFTVHRGSDLTPEERE